MDAELLNLLPAKLGTIRFDKHSAEAGGPFAEIFSDQLATSIVAARGQSTPGLTVAWSTAASADADRTFGLTFLAVKVPGASSRPLREVAVGDVAMHSAGRVPLTTFERGAKNYVEIGHSLVGTVADVVIIVSLGRDANVTELPASDGWTSADFEAALPATDPLASAPFGGSVPSLDPQQTPVRDLALESVIPSSIAGMHVSKKSGVGNWTMSDFVLGVPVYVLERTLGIGPETMSAALGSTDSQPPYVVAAVRVPDVDALRLNGAFVDDLAVVGSTSSVETLRANGRTALLIDDNRMAVAADDGQLYWMSYFDLGDHFGSMPPVRPLRDLVMDTLQGLPDAG